MSPSDAGNDLWKRWFNMHNISIGWLKHYSAAVEYIEDDELK